MDPDRDDAARLRRGDTAGLAGLMGRHQDRLFRYLLRLVGDEAVAEDAFQQTWLQVAERIGRYDAVAAVRAVALRGGPQPRPRPPAAAAAREPGRRGRARRAGGVEADPLAHAVARQQSARLADAVAGLAPLDREVLSLRFEEDLALPQLAETLGVPVPTAKARLYRALARLRERLLAGGAGGGVAMSAHVTELLALAAAGALDPAEAARVEAHLAECAACAAEAGEWRRLAEGLGRLPAPRPSRALVARTVEAVEALLAERRRARLEPGGARLPRRLRVDAGRRVVAARRPGDGRAGAAPRAPVGPDGRVVRGLRGRGMVDGGRGRGAARPARAGGREDGMSRFDQEWALVPTGARWTAVLVAWPSRR